MMKLKYLIVCTFVWIFAFSGLHVDCQELYQSSPDFMDMSVSSHDLWSVHAVDDMGMCAKTCNFAPGCLSYTFNWITGDCRGHSDIFDIYTGPFVHDSGSQYYYNIVSTPETTVSTGSIISTTTTTKKPNGSGNQKGGGGGGETTVLPTTLSDRGQQTTQETTSLITSTHSSGGGQQTQETTTVITTTKSGEGEHTTQETTTV